MTRMRIVKESMMVSHTVAEEEHPLNPCYESTSTTTAPPVSPRSSTWMSTTTTTDSSIWPAGDEYRLC
jgi:hypothetical protein